MKAFPVFLLLIFLSLACSFDYNLRKNAEADSAAKVNAGKGNNTKQDAAEDESGDREAIEQSIDLPRDQIAAAQSKSDCLKTRRSGKPIDAKQTFVLDFEPFRGTCFVTFHDPEYKNPPLNSEFYVYRGGKQIFEFPNRFNGVSTGCWVEAVSFVDLNEDNLKDVIIVGLCGAKAGAYNENTVYINTGDGFETNEDANNKLSDFKRVREIENFVRRNRELFFK